VKKQVFRYRLSIDINIVQNDLILDMLLPETSGLPGDDRELHLDFRGVFWLIHHDLFLIFSAHGSVRAKTPTPTMLTHGSNEPSDMAKRRPIVKHKPAIRFQLIFILHLHV